MVISAEVASLILERSSSYSWKTWWWPTRIGTCFANVKIAVRLIEAVMYVLVIGGSFLSELVVCPHPLILLCQASSSTASARASWGNKGRTFLTGHTTGNMKGPPRAVVQLPASQDPLEGLFMSAQTPATAGAEICWEAGSQGLGVGSTWALLEGHMGKGRGMWEVLGKLSFPPPALSPSQRDGNLILVTNMIRCSV